MVKFVVAAIAALQLCASQQDIERSATTWAQAREPIGLIHVACRQPFLSRATCTFYYQGWEPRSAECTASSCSSSRPGAEVTP